MILHGNSRAGATDLARHLLRDDENDHVHVHEVSGFMANDLHGAFHEVEALSRGTRCEKFLFSLALSPPKGGNVTTEEFEAAIDKAEAALGLTGQPRVIVFHEKGDNRDRHAHAVWSRIDIAEMKAIPMDFHRMKQRDVSRELFIQHGWEMPQGLINREERNPLNYTFDQYQHAKRLGKNAGQIKSDLLDAWAVSDNRTSFEHALRDKGFRLAKGDRRGFLAVDTDGKEFSVPKWLGIQTKAVRERLGSENDFPSLADTKVAIGRNMLGKMDEFNAELRNRKDAQKSQSLIQRKALVTEQRQERAAAFAKMDQRQIAEANARQAKFRRGLLGAWDWMRGENRRIKQENEADAVRCQKRDTAQREALITQQREARQQLSEKLSRAKDRLKDQHRTVAEDKARFQDMANTPTEPKPEPVRRQRRPASEHKRRTKTEVTPTEPQTPHPKQAFKEKRRAQSQTRRARAPSIEP
ncbi:MAG: relaxase [Pseudomonadota bacterium]